MKKSIFLFFAAILCSMTANAYDQSAVDLYFDNSEAKWSNCFVYIGHGSWTSCYPLTRVSGTQYLWQLAKDFNGGNSWNGASGWVVCKEKWWDSNGETIDKFVYHGAKNVTEKKTSAWSASYIYKTDGTKSVTSDGKTETVYKLTSSTKSNYTVTISTVEGGTLTVKDYDNATVSNGASKIKLTVLKFSATPASGYIFDGVQINNGSTTTTISAANISSETYTLTSNVTITPIWKATTSTVTVTANATNGTVAGAGVYEEGASVTLTATPADGYKFVNWTVAGAEVSTANPYTFTAEADVTVTANFEELPKETIYFVNNKEWSTVNAYAWNKPNDTNNGWPGVAATKTEEKVAGFDVYSFTAAEGQYTHVIFNTDGSQTENLVWTAGKYYWMGAETDFAGATKEEAETKLAAPLPETWTIVGAKGLLGTEWDVNASANNMQLQQDGSYILTRDDISLAKGDYEYKAVKDHSYNVAIPQNGNQKLTIETAGIYDITFTLKDSKLTTVATLVKAEVIIPTVFVAGKNLNKWSTTANELILSKDSLTASATIALKEGTDSIKMVVGGNWLGNNGTMTRENDGQAWTFKADEGNCAIVADIAGNYVFTWNFDKNQLTVTYPELPTYNVTATVNPAETGSVEGAKEYKQGEQATLTATAAEGYEFTCWTAGKDTVSTENPYTFTVTANVDLVANFKKSVVTHDFYVEDVTVTKGQWSIDLAGSWNEQAFVLRLWQDNTQGFGTYAANAETGYSATLGVKELTPTAEGYYMQDPMNENAFIFQGTMTDGADIYEVYLKGALASESETGEMEAKTEVAFSCNADGVWSIEAFADDYSWGLMLEVVPNLETSEYVATGYYVTDIEAGVTEEVAGTGMLYFDDFSGCQVFKGNLTTESGNIYPTLYASSLELITNEIMTDPSWIGEIAGVDYYEVLLMANNYLWELDLHARNCTGDPGTYTVDIVDVEEGAYSTFMSASAVTGELTIYEDNSYEANVTTVDNEGNPAMSISVFAWAAAAEEYNIVITNATVTENTFGYYIDMIGEWEGHTIKVEVCDELDTETIRANFFIDGGIANNGDQAEGTVEATVNEGVVTITGTFECLGSGAVYNVTISGTLPGGTTTSLDNLNTTVAPVKMIENGQLIIINNGVQYNAQGAVIK